jgi:hypothetical protein
MSANIEDLGAKLVLVLCFLGIFFGVILIMPSVFMTGANPTYNNPNIPKNLRPQDLVSLKYYLTNNLTKNGPSQKYDFSSQGPNFKFTVQWQFSALRPDDHYYFDIQRENWRFWVWYSTDFMAWSGAGGSNSLIWSDSLGARFAPLKFFQANIENDTGISKVSAQDNAITVTVFLADSNSTRNNVTQAWNDGTLTVSIGLGVSSTEAKMSAWDIVSRLLTFQAPQIFGGGDVGLFLNFMIALPIYGVIAYLIYRLILMAIPFL